MPGCSTCIERATDLSWLSPAGKPPLAYGEKLVQKRSAIIILLIVVAAAGVLVYLTERSLQQEVHLTASPNILTPRKAGATAEVLKTSPMREGAYSENEYARLRQRYKPRPPAAEGASERICAASYRKSRKTGPLPEGFMATRKSCAQRRCDGAKKCARHWRHCEYDRLLDATLQRQRPTTGLRHLGGAEGCHQAVIGPRRGGLAS